MPISETSTHEEKIKERDDLIAKIVDMCDERHRQKAKKLVAELLLLTALQEALQVGRIVQDRHGRIWLAEWLPAHNGEVFEP